MPRTKPFHSNTSNNNSNTSSASPVSSPATVHNPMPVQVEDEDEVCFETLVGGSLSESIPSRASFLVKKRESTGPANGGSFDELPRLEAAGGIDFMADVEQELDQHSPSASLSKKLCFL